MPNSDLLPSLLFKKNQNQLALEAANMEFTKWVEERGSSDVAENVRGELPGSSALRRKFWLRSIPTANTSIRDMPWKLK